MPAGVALPWSSAAGDGVEAFNSAPWGTGTLGGGLGLSGEYTAAEVKQG